jgi:hypothetical protein
MGKAENEEYLGMKGGETYCMRRRLETWKGKKVKHGKKGEYEKERWRNVGQEMRKNVKRKGGKT